MRAASSILIVSTLMAMSVTAHAQSFELNIDIDDAVAAQAGIADVAALENELTSQFDSTLVLEEQTAYMDQMANANVLSAKGMGVDYATKFKRFILGGGFGTAVNSAGFTFSRGDTPLPTGGFAFQASVMGGINLGGFSPGKGFGDRVRIYGNGLYSPVGGDPFSGELLNYGAHLQFALINPTGRKHSPVRFLGLDLTSGYERSRYVMRLSHAIPIPTGDVSWDASGDYTITSDTTSVPIELSTGLRVAVVSAYVGGAADINLTGTADGEIGLNGDLSAVNPQTGDDFRIGSAGVTASATGAASQLTPRIFGGAVLHIMFLNIYGHLNVTLDRSVGGHLGARVAF